MRQKQVSEKSNQQLDVIELEHEDSAVVGWPVTCPSIDGGRPHRWSRLFVAPRFRWVPRKNLSRARDVRNLGQGTKDVGRHSRLIRDKEFTMSDRPARPYAVAQFHRNVAEPGSAG
jgi:hypothetical protein